MKRYLVNFLILTAVFFPEAYSGLTANYLDVKLPSINYCQTPFYDGDDQIYLFGGCEIYNMDKFLSFSISSQTIQELGLLPGVAYEGSVQPDSHENLFYFGGGSDSNQVYKYGLNTRISSWVATLPYNTYGSKSLKHNDTSNIVYILGGYLMEDKILAFDLETYTSSVVATIPADLNLALRTIDRIGNNAYGFGLVNLRAIELDLNSLEMKEVGSEILPIFTNHPASVRNGTFIYLVGGYWGMDGVKTGNIIQFNSETFASKFSPVSGLRLLDAKMFSKAPASVYVPRLNRIYCFGGESFTENFVRYDDIFYINMDSDFVDFDKISGASRIFSQLAWILLLNLFIFFYQSFS